MTITPDLEKAANELVPFMHSHAEHDHSARVAAVRAVLLAIREPSEAMAVAGGRSVTFDDGWMGEDVGKHRSPKLWQAMIDTILGDGK